MKLNLMMLTVLGVYVTVLLVSTILVDAALSEVFTGWCDCVHAPKHGLCDMLINRPGPVYRPSA